MEDLIIFHPYGVFSFFLYPIFSCSKNESDFLICAIDLPKCFSNTIFVLTNNVYVIFKLPCFQSLCSFTFNNEDGIISYSHNI